MSTEGFYKAHHPSLWQRLGFGHAATPNMDEFDDSPDFCESALHTDCYLVFDWKDRLRVLISGKAMVAIRTKTDTTVAKSASKCRVSVLPPTWTPSA